VKIYDINEFLMRVVSEGKSIALLSLDIEGIDAEVILDVNWGVLNFYRLSFEYLHLGAKTEGVLRHLAANDCIFIGRGVDSGGFDFMYEKVNFVGSTKGLQLQPMALSFGGPIATIDEVDLNFFAVTRIIGKTFKKVVSRSIISWFKK
jgi:hypothetical protein